MLIYYFCVFLTIFQLKLYLRVIHYDFLNFLYCFPAERGFVSESQPMTTFRLS